MKTATFLFFFVLLGSLSYGQNVTDQSLVLQQCMNLAELQQTYHVNGQGEATLVITDNGVVPSQLGLTRFGKPVLFKTTASIASESIQACLTFNSITFGETTTQVSYLYEIKGVSKTTFNITLEKMEGHWFIVKNNTVRE